MGPFSPNNILVLLCTGLLIQLCSLPLIAADPTPLEKLYSLVKEGAKGDCTAQLADLKTSYTAGLAMAQAAIDAIDAVKNGKMSNWVKTSKNNRRAQMLQAMFQIRAAGITHPMSSEDSTNLGKVQRKCNSRYGDYGSRTASLTTYNRNVSSHDRQCEL